MILPARTLALVTLLACALAGALLGYALLSIRPRPVSRLGLRGLKRTLALRESAAFRALDPLLRWLAPRLSALVPAPTLAHLEQQITRGGELYGLVPSEIAGMSLLACTSLGAATYLYAASSGSRALLVLLAAALGAVLPYLHVTGAARQRVRAIQRGLPQVVDLLILGLGAGLDFSSALRQVVDYSRHGDTPVTEELRLVLHELQLGHTRQQALRALHRRAPCEAIADLVAAAAQSEEQGTPLARVLAAQATSARERRSSAAEEAASRAAAGLLFPMILLFGAVMLLIGAPILIQLTGKAH